MQVLFYCFLFLFATLRDILRDLRVYRIGTVDSRIMAIITTDNFFHARKDFVNEIFNIRKIVRKKKIYCIIRAHEQLDLFALCVLISCTIIFPVNISP
jgi:hypothetical protein